VTSDSQIDLAVAVDPREDHDASGSEVFDRLAFARWVLARIRPRRVEVALCGNSARLRVLVGRAWGRPAGERWALVAVPATASRRAIALAMTQLAEQELPPYFLDVLLAPAASAFDYPG